MNGTGCALPIRLSCVSASTSNISSKVPTPPGSAKKAVRSSSVFLTPASTRPCFLAEKNDVVR